MPFPTKDDICYLSFFSSLFGYAANPICASTNWTYGLTLFWFPAGFIAKGFELLQIDTFNWSLSIGIGFTSFLLWVFGLFLFKKIWNHPFPYWIVYLSFPILPYVTYRTHLAHPAEFLLSLLFIFFLLRKRFSISTICLILLIATRMNAMFLIPVLGAAIYQEKLPLNRNLKLALGFLMTMSGFLFFKTLLFGYNGRQTADFATYLFDSKNLWEILFGNSWGLAWSSTAFLFSFILGLIQFKKLSLLHKAIVLQFALNFIFTVSFKSNASLYGYRLMIFSFVALVPLMVEQLHSLFSRQPHFGRAFIKPCLYLFMVLTMTWQLLLAYGYPYWGGKSFVVETFVHYTGATEKIVYNPDYQFYILKALVSGEIFSKETTGSSIFLVQSIETTHLASEQGLAALDPIQKIVFTLTIGLALAAALFASLLLARKFYGRQQR
jgi:hypothetical protein